MYVCNRYVLADRQRLLFFLGPDPLWNDLLKRHAQEPIHLLVGGGDQIYCDAIAREPEITPWIDETNMEKKMQSMYICVWCLMRRS